MILIDALKRIGNVLVEFQDLLQKFVDHAEPAK